MDLDPLMSQSFLQMHWSVATWIIVILLFIVCHCKLSQGSRISKIVCQCLLLLHPASFILLQPLSLFTGFLQNDESSFKPCISYTGTSPLKNQYIWPHICLCIHLLLTQDMAIQRRWSITCLIIVPQKFIPTGVLIWYSKTYYLKIICHWKGIWTAPTLSWFRKWLETCLFQKYFISSFWTTGHWCSPWLWPSFKKLSPVTIVGNFLSFAVEVRLI